MKQICIKIYLANPLVVHFANIPQECGVLRWKIVIQNCSTLIVDVIWQGAQVPLEARELVLRTFTVICCGPQGTLVSCHSL